MYQFGFFADKVRERLARHHNPSLPLTQNRYKYETLPRSDRPAVRIDCESFEFGPDGNHIFDYGDIFEAVVAARVRFIGGFGNAVPGFEQLVSKWDKQWVLRPFGMCTYYVSSIYLDGNQNSSELDDNGAAKASR